MAKKYLFCYPCNKCTEHQDRTCQTCGNVLKPNDPRTYLHYHNARGGDAGNVPMAAAPPSEASHDA